MTGESVNLKNDQQKLVNLKSREKIFLKITEPQRHVAKQETLIMSITQVPK